MRLYEELARTGLEDLKMSVSLASLDSASQEAAAGNWFLKSPATSSVDFPSLSDLAAF